MRGASYLGAVIAAALSGCHDNIGIFNIGVHARPQTSYQQSEPSPPQAPSGLEGTVLLPTDQLSAQDRAREDLLVDEQTNMTYRRRVVFVPAQGQGVQVSYCFGDENTPYEEAVVIAREFYAQLTLAHANGSVRDLSGYTLLRVMQTVDGNHDRKISSAEVNAIDPNFTMPRRSRINGLVRGQESQSQRPLFNNRTQ